MSIALIKHMIAHSCLFIIAVCASFELYHSQYAQLNVVPNEWNYWLGNLLLVPAWVSCAVLYLNSTNLSKRVYQATIAFTAYFFITHFIAESIFHTHIANNMDMASYRNNWRFLTRLFFESPFYFYFSIYSRLLEILMCASLSYFLYLQKSENPVFASSGIKRQLALIPIHIALCLTGTFSYTYFALQASAASESAGSLAFNLDGLQSNVRTWEKNGTKIVLVPMVHIGEEKFYSKVKSLYQNNLGVTLLEGVDTKNCEVPLDYRGLASAVGISHQAKSFLQECESEGSRIGGRREFKCRGHKMKYLQADLDASKFHPSTQRYLKIMAEEFSSEIHNSARERQEAIARRFGGISADYFQLEIDLLDKRNENLHQVLHESEKEFKFIVIPWGAAHIKQFELYVESLGYKLKEEKKLRIMGPIEYAKLTYY